jgi:hypothetical protein
MDSRAAKDRFRKASRVFGLLYARTPTWFIAVCSVVVFFGGVAALQLGTIGVPLVLLGAVFAIVNFVSTLSRGTGGYVDPELRFAWSVSNNASVITWRLKAVTDPTRFRRGGRFTVGLFGALTLLACAGYGVIGWNITRSGLRPRDLPTLLPVTFIALLLLGVVIRIAWKALHDLVPYEVSLDTRGKEIHCTGLQPKRGITTASIPLQSIARLKSSQSTYKGVTIVRVFAYGTDGERHVLFGGLNTDDWYRISTDLLPAFQESGIPVA